MSEENEETTEPEAPESAEDAAPAAAEDTAPEAEAPAEQAAPEAEPPATDAGPEVEAEAPAAEEAPQAEPAAADASAAAEPEPAPEKPAPEKKPEGDVVPGANLEPIAITEERELTAEEKAALEAEEEERASREAAAAREDDEVPARAAVSVPADTSVQATGKRKNAVARVILRAGSGEVEVNGRSLDDYFPRAHHQSIARQPLVTAGYDGAVAVSVSVHGGGITGQAGAVRHGIARALVDLDPELRGDLKRRGMLTRDARQKERRKAGLKKARKRPQFSKR